MHNKSYRDVCFSPSGSRNCRTNSGSKVGFKHSVVIAQKTLGSKNFKLKLFYQSKANLARCSTPHRMDISAGTTDGQPRMANKFHRTPLQFKIRIRSDGCTRDGEDGPKLDKCASSESLPGESCSNVSEQLYLPFSCTQQNLFPLPY